MAGDLPPMLYANCAPNVARREHVTARDVYGDGGAVV